MLHFLEDLVHQIHPTPPVCIQPVQCEKRHKNYLPDGFCHCHRFVDGCLFIIRAHIKPQLTTYTRAHGRTGACMPDSVYVGTLLCTHNLPAN